VLIAARAAQGLGGAILALLGVSGLALTESAGQNAGRQLDIAGAVALTLGTAALVCAIIGTDAHPWTAAQTIGPLTAAAILLAGFIVNEARYAHPDRAAQHLPQAITVSRRRHLGRSRRSRLRHVLLSLAVPAGGARLLAAARGPGVPADRRWDLGNSSCRRPFRAASRGPVTADPRPAAALWCCRLAQPTRPGVQLLSRPACAAAPSRRRDRADLRAADAVGNRRSRPIDLASGLLNTSRQKGGAIGLAVLATVATSVSLHQLAEGHAQASALTHGYSLAFLIIAAISVASALAACLLRGEAVPDADSEAEPVAFEYRP
jgi:hypothetical protein